MTLPTENLLQQYFDDRLALAKLSFTQRTDQAFDANLTMHELRIVLLVASGAAATTTRLTALLQVPLRSVEATLSGLIEHGYLIPKAPENERLTPTEEAVELFEAVTDRRDVTLELLAGLAPEDLTALVQGTHALRLAMEEDAPTEGGLLEPDTLQQLQRT